MTTNMGRGFLSAERIVLLILLIASLGVVAWVYLQMHAHEAEETAARNAPAAAAAPAAASAPAAAAAPETAPVLGTAVAAPEAPGATPTGGDDVARLHALTAAHTASVASLNAQAGELARQRDDAQWHQTALSNLNEELRAVRDALAAQQTQAFMAERELLKIQLRADSAQDALMRAQDDARDKQAEILRLRQMIEELSGISPPMLKQETITNAARRRVIGRDATVTFRQSTVPPPAADVPPSAAVAPPSAAVAPPSAAVVPPSAAVVPPSVVPPPGGMQTPEADASQAMPDPAARSARVLVVTPRVPRPAPAAPDDDELMSVAADEQLTATLAASAPAVHRAPPQPAFTPEAGTRPSLSGMLNGGYRIICAPFMVPYGIISGAAAPLRDDPEQNGSTNYAAFGLVQVLALPFSMGFNSIAGAGAGSMDAVQGCLDVVTLGTYSAPGTEPCIMQVLDEE